jgi:hypothetical protein
MACSRLLTALGHKSTAEKSEELGKARGPEAFQVFVWQSSPILIF